MSQSLRVARHLFGPTRPHRSRAAARLGTRRLRAEMLEKRLLLDCSTPRVQNVRGKDATFDQCFNLEFEHNGTDYEVSAYYTETTTPADLTECTATENMNGRCEHALANNDDGNGDNVFAVGMATEARDAFRFYLDRNLKFIPAGETELEVFVAEDPRIGGVPTLNSLLVDDEFISNGDPLWQRLLAVHELHHLVQFQYDGSWVDFYGEGIARSVEDRYDTTLDPDTGHLFIPQITTPITSNATRSADLSTINYDSAAWWTWLWDQYRVGAAQDPPVPPNDIGWQAIRDFYLELETQQSNELGAIADFISAQGSSFRQDFIDYTLALYAQSFNPADARLGFIDNEINAIGALSGHTIINSAPAFGNVNLNLNPRSSQYIEFNPASQCDFTAFTFDGQGSPYGFSVMTVDGGTLQKRWTSYSNTWARTVRTADLDRIVGVVSAFDQSGPVTVGRGCVAPNLNIKSPTDTSFVMVGTADNPRAFVVRLSVTGGGGAAVAGLVASDFTVTLKKSSGGPDIPANVINSSYVLDDYWLLVQAPDDGDGAESGQFYDLSVALGANTDTETFSVVYLERVQDVMFVLDRSGSMGGTTGKIEAARNAANLLVNTLTDDDQAGYVAFDTDADVQVSLDELGDGSQRQDLEDSIAAEMPLNRTSIGDGLREALDDYNSNAEPTNMCSFVLMSDGHENEPEYWATVKNDIIAAGCPVHAIALGPGANEVLMQEIAGSVSGGTYDYATSSGGVPINSVINWENNLSRLYEGKATEIAGRETILTALGDSAIGGVTTGIVDFEDLPAGGNYSVGDTFLASGLVGRAMTFFFADGTPHDLGRAMVDTNQQAGGVGQDMQLGNINVGFEFAQPLESASLLFGYFGGNLNVEINGELANVRTLSLLQGRTIGGVTVNFSMFDNQHGRMEFKGPIDKLAIGGQEFWIDSLRFNSPVGNFHEIPVDDASDVLVVATAWQEPDGGAHTELIDPDGNAVPDTMRRMSAKGTNEVWHVPDPIHGIYRLQVRNLPQEYFITASARSDYELYTFVGQPVDMMLQGVEVPLVASFISSDKPVLGANVTATVRNPQGLMQVVPLFDDGNHGDGEADDGVYANKYTATAIGDIVELNPDDVVEGMEPQGVGSYQVSFLAIKGDIRREGLGSFAINRAPDSDSDGLPDNWEKEHGKNPDSREDRFSDVDMDGLPNWCEFMVGTDPRNSDTDSGGESDGSEVQIVAGAQLCRPVRDPHNPRDDRVRPLSSLVAFPVSTLSAGPHVRVHVGVPAKERYLFSQIKRRALDDSGRVVEDWRVLIEQLDVEEFIDREVKDDLHYEYMAIPFFAAGQDEPPIMGRAVATTPVEPVKDPYAPGGSLLINGGAPTTHSPYVTLNLSADDEGHVHDNDIDDEPVPGTPLERLMMKISNRPDLSDAEWQPYQSEVKDWYLGAVGRPQALITVEWVFVAFMDEAGNISATASDSIRVVVQEGDTFPFDGTVNLDDLNHVRNSFGQQVTPGTRGDAIGAIDGMVTLDDLNQVRNHFGESVVGAPVTAASLVPRGLDTPALALASQALNGHDSASRSQGVPLARSSREVHVDALFGRFTEVGVDIDALLPAHRLAAKRGVRVLR